MAKKASKSIKSKKKATPAKSVVSKKKKNVKSVKSVVVAKKPQKAKKQIKKAGAAKKAIKPPKTEKNTKALPTTKKQVVVKKEAIKDKAISKPIVKPVAKTEPKVTPPSQKVQKQKKAGRVPKPKKIKQTFTPFNPIQPFAEKVGSTSKKEPAGKFELEYVIRCSESLLYDFITSPSGLSEWFADNVNIRDGVYTFVWDGSQQQARLLALKEDRFVRYQWTDKDDGSYFEFRIQTDELTSDISLIIVDFSDDEEERISAKLLWDAQVEKLMKTIGSHS